MNNNPATFTKILNGINNTLSIANKVMPIYKEAKPIVQTVTKTYKNIKNNKNNFPSLTLVSQKLPIKYYSYLIFYLFLSCVVCRSLL